jgi:hypothetical protein
MKTSIAIALIAAAALCGGCGGQGGADTGKTATVAQRQLDGAAIERCLRVQTPAVSKRRFAPKDKAARVTVVSAMGSSGETLVIATEFKNTTGRDVADALSVTEDDVSLMAHDRAVVVLGPRSTSKDRMAAYGCVRLAAIAANRR